MQFIESINTAISSLFANKLRSLLTMLGIIIGVASVIALTSLGGGFSNLIDTQITTSGASLIYVTGTTDKGFPSLSLDDAEVLANTDATENIREVATLSTINGAVASGDATLLARVLAVSDNYFVMNDIADVTEGTLFAETSEQVAVLGASVAEDLFPDGTALGRSITLFDETYEVIAILAPEPEDPVSFGDPDSESGGESDEGDPFTLVPGSDKSIYVPIGAAIDLLPLNTTETGDIALSTLVVSATDETVIEAATDEISTILRTQHGLEGDASNDFRTQNQGAIADAFATITGALTLFLSAIAGISLLVGGIGIMNIMLVSVTERTREIGIRKAVGALRRDILRQFILESLMLSLVGGGIGFLLGWVLSAVSGSLINVSPVVSATTVAMAIGFSMAVGLIFGVYPAWKAARLLPIDALRYE